MRGDNPHSAPVDPCQQAGYSSRDHDAVLERFGVTPEEKENLVAVLRGIMENFVDRAFGIDPVQQVTASLNADVSFPSPAAGYHDRRPLGRAKRRRAPQVNRISNSSEDRKKRSCSKKSLP